MFSLDIVAENFEAFENDIFDCKPTRTPLLLPTTPSYACLFLKVSATNKLLFYQPTCG